MSIHRLGVALCALFVLTHCASPLRDVLSAAAGVVVSGTVSGSEQGPLNGASVEIDGPTRRAAKTDADGRFALADVPPGRYKIRIAADEHLPIERDMEVGDKPVSLDVVLLHLPGLP